MKIIENKKIDLKINLTYIEGIRNIYNPDSELKVQPVTFTLDHFSFPGSFMVDFLNYKDIIKVIKNTEDNVLNLNLNENTFQIRVVKNSSDIVLTFIMNPDFDFRVIENKLLELADNYPTKLEYFEDIILNTRNDFNINNINLSINCVNIKDEIYNFDNTEIMSKLPFMLHFDDLSFELIFSYKLINFDDIDDFTNDDSIGKCEVYLDESDCKFLIKRVDEDFEIEFNYHGIQYKFTINKEGFIKFAKNFKNRVNELENHAIELKQQLV